MHDPLRNPYWSALCTEQAPVALGNNLARRFPADVIPFAGVASTEEKALAALHALLGPSESIYITSDEPCSYSRLEQTKDMPGIQMVCMPEAQHSTTDADADVTGAPVVERLDAADGSAMLTLKALAFPGYFGPRASSLGRFYGIRAGETLVAMAGERLALPGLREISALCTHPDHTGHGYAAALLRHLMREHSLSGLRSFLHVVSSNARAIALYQRLGFVQTRTLVWRCLERVG